MSASDGFEELFGGGGDIDSDIGGDITAVLDSAELLRERDTAGLLWSIATAGAQIRLGVTAAPTWLSRLGSAERPRSILIASDQYTGCVTDLIVEMCAAAVPVLPWQRAQLPGWAGPADVLLAMSIDGMHPRVAGLVAEADRRGLEVVLVAPITSPVSAGAGRAIRVDLDPDGPARTLFWTVATPLLLACAALHVGETDESVLLDVADALDALARRCGLVSEVYANEAKQLAVELAETDAVLLGCGPLPGLAARRTAQALNEVAGRGALALELPDCLDEALMLARCGAGAGGVGAGAADFFRDRVDTPGPVRRMLTFSPPPLPPAPERAPGGLQEDHDDAPDVLQLATARSAAAVRTEAESAGVRYSEVVPEAPGTLAAYAEQSLLGEFVAAYVALGTGIDLRAGAGAGTGAGTGSGPGRPGRDVR